MIILLAVSIILNLISLYFLMWGVFPKSSTADGSGSTSPLAFTIDKSIYDTIMKVEYEKVGWKENYDLLNQANRIQLQSQIPQIRSFIENSGSTDEQYDQNQQVPPPSNTGTFSQDEVTSILKDAYIEWNKDADVIFVEYSDMECPFCIRQQNDTKPFNVLKEKYPDIVAHTFKNNRWVDHPGTEAKAIWALCAGKVAGAEKYIAFYHEIFAQSTMQSVSPVSSLSDIATKIWIDTVKWKTCLDSKETADRFQKETAEAQKLWLSGTPGNLILNRKTGKYVKIEWAYPSDTFVQAVEQVK